MAASRAIRLQERSELFSGSLKGGKCNTMNSNLLMEQPQHEKAFRYWQGKVFELEGMTSLDYYSSKQTGHKKCIPFDLDDRQINRLKHMTKGNELAAYVILQAAIHCLLYRYHGNAPHSILIPGKKEDNALTILQVDGDESFRNLLNKTKSELQSIYRYGSFSLEHYIEKEFGQSIYDYSNIACSMYDQKDKFITNEHISYLFTLSFGNTVEIQLMYDESVDPSMAKLVQKHFMRLLDEVLADMDITIDEIDLLGDADRQIVYNQLHELAGYNEQLTIPEVFTDIVNAYPDKTAIVCGRESLTYSELNARANQVAHFLRSNGIQRDDLVGVYFNKSLEVIISILGVLKSGAAYVPLDATHPMERSKMICEASKLQCILTEHETDLFGHGNVMPVDSPSIQIQSMDDPVYINQSDDLAYIIFTSGSTGKPKGVMIEHRNVIRLLINDMFEFDFNADDVWTMFHSHCFDFSVWEIFGALFNASELIIIPDEMTVDQHKLWEWMHYHQVTVFNQTPHSFYQFIKTDALKEQKLNALRYVIFGGEELHPDKCIDFHEKYPETTLVNMYGITETTVHVTYKALTTEDMQRNVSNIGVPLSTLKVFVVDEWDNILPVGVVGEICVSGEGLARGYLNNDGLTNEKFVPMDSDLMGRVYKTGDLGRYLSNGELEYIGRRDFQVNVRGYRIEMGEVQTQLAKISGINGAIADVEWNVNSEKSIVAYYVADEEISSELIRQNLKRTLPSYMIPASFRKVEYIPLNQNGKVDKDKLEQLVCEKSPGSAGKEADDDLGNILVKIWADVLAVETIYTDDNFYEVGGDSIKAIQIISQLKQHGYDAKVQHLLNHPTIETFRTYITKSFAESTADKSIEGVYPLTPIQHEYFREWQGKSGPNYYNQSLMIYKNEGWDENIIRQTFETIMLQHDNLRSVFETDDNAVQARIRPYRTGQFAFDIHHLYGSGNFPDEITEIAEFIQSTLDIRNGPLVRLALFKTDFGDHLLFIIHHLLMDGLSWRILLEDFNLVYDQLVKGGEVTLPQRTTSFQEWSRRLHAYAEQLQFRESPGFWGGFTWNETKNAKDHQKVMGNMSIKTLQLQERPTTQLLQDANHAYNTKPNEILMTALGLAIKESYPSDDNVIALESHGRENDLEGVDLNRTVGWFTNIFPFKLYADKHNIAKSIVVNKDNLRRMTPESNDYLINKHLIDDEKWNSYQTPAISFNYLGQFDRELNTDLFQVSDVSFGKISSDDTVAPYVLDINCFTAGKELKINLGYQKDSISESGINEFADAFLEKIIQCIEACMNQEEQQHTPSDYSYKGLSLEELENIQAQINDH